MYHILTYQVTFSNEYRTKSIQFHRGNTPLLLCSSKGVRQASYHYSKGWLLYLLKLSYPNINSIYFPLSIAFLFWSVWSSIHCDHKQLGRFIVLSHLMSIHWCHKRHGRFLFSSVWSSIYCGHKQRGMFLVMLLWSSIHCGHKQTGRF